MPFPVALAVGLGAISLFIASRGKAAAGPGPSPTPGGAPAPGTTPPAGMPRELQAQMAECLAGLNVDGQGAVHPPITDLAIQRCTATAGVLEQAGYPQAGTTLRNYARLAAAYLPPADQKVAPTPAIPEAIRGPLNQAIDLERDPKKLRQWAATLRQLPRGQEPEVQAIVQWLEATAVQIELEQAQAEALAKINQTVTDGNDTAIAVPQPITIQPVPDSPTPPAPPGVPEPPALPKPKSRAEQAAEALVLHLWNLQEKYRTPKAVKASGKLDMTLVRRFQTAAKLNADGKPGPGCYISLAFYGQGRLPLVLYWPVGSTQQKVVDYQNGLEVVAEAAEKAGNARRAVEIRASAAREKGQGGVA